MAPEQFHGKAVFASDIYSLGVTMYPDADRHAALRHAVAGASCDKLMSGELVTAPQACKNAAIPKAISDIVMKAMAPEIERAVSARLRSAGRHPGPQAANAFVPPPGRVVGPTGNRGRSDSTRAGIIHLLRAIFDAADRSSAGIAAKATPRRSSIVPVLTTVTSARTIPR